jgi:hypothetical protein
MARRALLAAALLALHPVPAPAQEADCILCAPQPGQSAEARRERPLDIEITANLAFSRLALTGRGEGHAAIDPATGQRSVGGGMVDLGGVTVQGRGRITGQPGRTVRVQVPPVIVMTSVGGGEARLTDIVTDLPAYPVLDASGTLEFGFGGAIKVDGPLGGQFRGRIPITVDYN